MIYFGTDGIRGVAVDDITQEVCMKCGNALGSLKEKAKIILGVDTRVSNGFVFSSFASGATLAGANIYFVGIVPTPAISFLVQKHKADFGVMITASHNSAEYNGIKIFDCNGEKIDQMLQTEIERRFAKQKVVSALEVGKIICKPRYKAEYVQFVMQYGVRLDGLKIVLDSGNGAGYRIAGQVFKKLGAKVVLINSSKSGKNINKNCGALYPEKLQRVVKETGADVGFAFDGDADRIVLVDNTGKKCDGDQIVLFLTKMYIMHGLLKSGAVVATIQTNMAIERELNKMGVKLIRTDVGDINVTSELKKNNLQMGGEQAGHIVLFDYQKSGDGIFCAVQIAKFMKLSNQKLNENLFYNLLPQHTKNVFAEAKFEIINSAKFKVAVCECEQMLAGNGRIVTRASGTESKIRLMVETEDKNLAKRILDKLERATK